MTEIRKTNAVCTQITTVKLPPGKPEQALNLMIERARFMATQPGFVSVNLHRSTDGSHLINYIQWTSPECSRRRTKRPSFARSGRNLTTKQKPRDTQWGFDEDRIGGWGARGSGPLSPAIIPTPVIRFQKISAVPSVPAGMR